MTDGIIQEIFKKRRYGHTDKCHCGICIENKLLQQELIEEIKEECFDIEFKTYEYESIIKVKQLIGDSKE